MTSSSSKNSPPVLLCNSCGMAQARIWKQRGRHAPIFQAGDGHCYLLQAPASHTGQGKGHSCSCCWGCTFGHFMLHDNLNSNSSVSYSYKNKDNWNTLTRIVRLFFFKQTNKYQKTSRLSSGCCIRTLRQGSLSLPSTTKHITGLTPPASERAEEDSREKVGHKK